MKTLHTDLQSILNDANLSNSFVFDKFQIHFIYEGGNTIEYYFLVDGIILFSGNDLKPSPLRSIDGENAAIDLLGFLTVQPGDTDSEYFDNYTPEQLAWANSHECETLKGYVSDFGDVTSEYYQDAREYFQF